MKSLTFIEVDVDYCSLTYGVAPCEAELGVTGERKCFNTLATCQDRLHFDNEPVTLRFAVDTGYLHESGIDAIPSIESVGITPAVISLGVDLGQRASVRVTLRDHRHSDTGPGFDKYLADRDYDPFKLGTFWGKFRARQPYLRNRPLRLIRGLLGQSLTEMETEHFVIESFDGPTPSGTYTLVAKDVLKFMDGDRAQAPLLNNGYVSADISAAAGSFVLGPPGIGDTDYPASGWMALGGKEIVEFTRSGDNVTITRAQHGTEAIAHDAQDRAQVCLYFSSEDPANIINDLMTLAGTPAEYIPLSDWLAETGAHLRRTYTAMIAEPTSISKLISELVQQASLAIWWDQVTRLVRLQVLRMISTDAEVIDDSNRLRGQIGVREQPDKRVSQVWTYFGKINPLEGQEDPNNYRSTALTIDLEAETDYGSPAIMKIFSRWIPSFGRVIALRLNDIQLGRFRTPPRKFTYAIQRYNSVATAGAGYQLESWHIQDDTGEREIVPIQVTSLGREADRLEVEAEEMRFISFDEEDLDEHVVTVDTDVANFNLRTAHDALYPDPVSGDVVKCFVEEGVTIYSTTPNNPAFNLGSWPAGVTIDVTIRGRILGAGGAGGTGRNYQFGAEVPPTVGGQGGTALFSRYPFSLIQDGSKIWGGGGGGGGGNTNTFGADDDKGGGGGGGQGRNGGPPGVATAPGENGSPGTTSGPGVGGQAWSTFNWYDPQNYYLNTVRGGTGGVTGNPGQAGAGYGGSAGAAGGLPGYAIDGFSYASISGVGERLGIEGN